MIVFVSGVMAAGKSTVAQRLAERLTRSVHLRGDVFRRMIVNGRVEMTASAPPAALTQLRLRYRAAVATAVIYAEAGFDVIYQDVALGDMFTEVLSALERAAAGVCPVHPVVLCPDAATVRQREASRDKTGYHGFSVEDLQNVLNSTPRVGWWLDSSRLTTEDTVNAIVAHLENTTG